MLNHSCDSKARISILDVGGSTGRVWDGLLCPCIELTIMDPFFPQSGEQDLASVRLSETFQEGLPRLGDGSFDVVTAIDLIEHLSIAEGYKLLYEMERVARKSVLIYTPNGFVWQPPSTNNELNAHISGWTANELRRFGFTKIHGHVGLKLAVGPYAEPKFILRGNTLRLFNLCSFVLIRFFPQSAFALSATLSPGDRQSLPQSV